MSEDRELVLPKKNMSFELALSSINNMSERALCTFLYRLVQSLDEKQLGNLSRYVSTKRRRLENPKIGQ